MVGVLLLQPLVEKLKESALKMRQEKSFADNVINTTQALIIGLDADGKVVLFNHYSEENTGCSENEIKGSDFFNQFIPAEEQDGLRVLFTGMMSGEIETHMLIGTGDKINIVWNPTLIKISASGQPIMFLILMIGDVSGHGVAAGTMVGAAKAGVYPLIHEGVTSPSEILNSLNETMRVTAQQSLLITMACLSLDARTGKLIFANAGHRLPFLLRHKAKKWEMLEASGLPLGKSADSDYQESALELTLEEARELSAHEEVRIDIAVGSDVLGLMITDNWGTLMPGVFLRNIAHAMEEGVEAGVGGVGQYMMWRLSD